MLRGRLALLLIALLGLAVRLGPVLHTGLDNDEVYTMEDSILLLDDAPPDGARSFPLVYAATRVAIEFLGLEPSGMRWIPLLCGILAIFIVGRVGHSSSCLVSGRQALFGALLLALWPWHQYFSGYARYYAPLFLFSALAMLALWRVSVALRTPASSAGRPGFSAIFWGVAAVATHPSGIMAMSGLLAPMGDPEARRRIRRGGLIALFTVGVLFVLGAAFTPYGAPLRSVVSGKVGLGVGAMSLGLSLLNNVTLPIAAAGLLGGVVLLRRDPVAGRFLLLCAVLPVLAVAIFAAAGQAQARYTMAAMPAVILLAGVGLDSVVRGVVGQKRRALVVGAAILPLVPSLYSNVVDGDRHDWSGAAEPLASALLGSDLVIAEEHGLVGTHLFGFDYRTLPGEGDPPFPVALVEAPPQPQVLDAIEEHDSTTWLIIPENKIEAPPGTAYVELIEWMRPRARVLNRIGARRLDYHRNVIAVMKVGGTVQ